MPVEVSALTEMQFRFEDHLYDAVMDAFNSLERTVVVGEHINNFYQALDLQVAGDVSPGGSGNELTAAD